MRIPPVWLLFLSVPLLHASGLPGLKMTVHSTHDGISGDQTSYTEQDRWREEHRNAVGGEKHWYGRDVHYGPHLASIVRCDEGQAYDLNLDSGEYTEGPFPPPPLSKEQIEALGLNGPRMAASGKPTLRIETTTVDTGERKDFFGHTARHVITTTKKIPLEGSESSAEKTVKDGWYIDLDTSISCRRGGFGGKPVHAFVTAGNAPVERMEFIDKGEPETGFATQWKITTTEEIALANGTRRKQTFVSEMQITEFVEGPLDPGLFVVPDGFRKVESIERNPSSSLPSQR